MNRGKVLQKKKSVHFSRGLKSGCRNFGWFRRPFYWNFAVLITFCSVVRSVFQSCTASGSLPGVVALYVGAVYNWVYCSYCLQSIYGRSTAYTGKNLTVSDRVGAPLVWVCFLRCWCRLVCNTHRLIILLFYRIS